MAVKRFIMLISLAFISLFLINFPKADYQTANSRDESVTDIPVNYTETSLKIWPKSALDAGAGAQTETFETDRNYDVIRVSNITDPTIMVYKIEHVGAKTPAIVICPCGGYSCLAINKEGTEIADWFNSIGVTATECAPAMILYQTG